MSHPGSSQNRYSRPSSRRKASVLSRAFRVTSPTLAPAERDLGHKADSLGGRGAERSNLSFSTNNCRTGSPLLARQRPRPTVRCHLELGHLSIVQIPARDLGEFFKRIPGALLVLVSGQDGGDTGR